MKIGMTIKQFIWLCISIIATAFLMSTVQQALVEFASTGEDWASALIQALGNVIGGVIGGIVAVIVAAYQIQKTFQIEQKKQSQTTLTMLKLLREEIRDNIVLLENTIPYEVGYHSILKTQLSDDTWKSTLINLNVSDSLLVRLNVSYRKIALVKNLAAGEIETQFVQDTKDQFNSTLTDLLEEIRVIEADLK